MYIHLGNDVAVRQKDIIGIFDFEKATVSKETRDFLKKCEQDNIVTNVSDDLPKSFVLCGLDGGGHVFISAISPATLFKRAWKGDFN